MLSLHVEAEARQVAQLAWQEGRQNAITVSADTPLLQAHPPGVRRGIQAPRRQARRRVPVQRRAGRACTASGRRRGWVSPTWRFSRSTSRARAWRAPISARSRSTPPRRSIPGMPARSRGFDLANVRFLDMPWMLQPDHPAVMVYPRQDYRDRRPRPLLRARHRRFPRRAGAAFRQARHHARRRDRTPHAGRRPPVPARPDRRAVQRRQADGSRARSVTAAATPPRRWPPRSSKRRGLKIVERNYRCRFGEIDLVARSGATTVFVEVRARTSRRVRRRRRQHHGGQAQAPARRPRATISRGRARSARAASTSCSSAASRARHRMDRRTRSGSEPAAGHVECCQLGPQYMDLITRISENFSESAHLKLQAMDALAGPIAAAAERMVQCLKQDGKILAAATAARPPTRSISPRSC